MARPKPVRLDRLIVKRGWALTLEAARALVDRGAILLDGVPAVNAASQVRPDRPLRFCPPTRSWVGRGAQKMLGALEALPMDVEGHWCADLGSSTGGFTEVLLDRGAAHVFAVDVGRGLLHRRLELDPRVSNLEGTNVRTLTSLPRPVTRITGDLSFISLSLVLPVVARLLEPGGQALLLVKPQFEARKEDVLPGGRVSPEVRSQEIAKILEALEAEGLVRLGDARSTVPGAKSGNVEHFVWFQAPAVADG